VGFHCWDLAGGCQASAPQDPNPTSRGRQRATAESGRGSARLQATCWAGSTSTEQAPCSLHHLPHRQGSPSCSPQSGRHPSAPSAAPSASSQPSPHPAAQHHSRSDVPGLACEPSFLGDRGPLPSCRTHRALHRAADLSPVSGTSFRQNPCPHSVNRSPTRRVRGGDDLAGGRRSRVVPEAAA